MEKILIVEDSPEFQKIIGRALHAYDLIFAGSAEEADTLVRQHAFDLVILDITLPGRNGHTFLSELQSQSGTRDIPVICVTGKGDITDKTTAFSLGADDYLVKPFDPMELKARVDSKLGKRRRSTQAPDLFVIGIIRIDRKTHQVLLASPDQDSEEIHLTPTEYKILSFLSQRAGHVYSRDQLLNGVWGNSANVLDRVVDVHVCSLRKKLKQASTYIRSVPGTGYALSEPKKDVA